MDVGAETWLMTMEVGKDISSSLVALERTAADEPSDFDVDVVMHRPQRYSERL